MFRNQDEDEEIHQARHHYVEAEVDGCTIYKLYDDAHVKVSCKISSFSFTLKYILLVVLKMWLILFLFFFIFIFRQMKEKTITFVKLLSYLRALMGHCILLHNGTIGQTTL